MTIREALAEATTRLERAGKPDARLDAELLLVSVLGCGREALYRDPERRLARMELDRFRESVERRRSGVPVQHITGTREFWSIPLRVAAGALIPRPETEFVVQAALDRWPRSSPVSVLDLGTGSGCIAAALAAERADAQIVASDISLAALELAAENVRRNGFEDRVRLVCGSLFSPFRPSRACWDLVVSNPPYISERERDGLPEEVAGHEPPEALFSGPCGTEVIERIVGQAPAHLAPGGWLIMEVGAGQWTEVQSMVDASDDWNALEWQRDLAGIRRVACLRRHVDVSGAACAGKGTGPEI